MTAEPLVACMQSLRPINKLISLYNSFYRKNEPESDSRLILNKKERKMT